MLLSQEHAALVAVLQAKVGEDVGGTILQALALRLQDFLGAGTQATEGAAAGGAGKQSDNALVLVSHLYNFRVSLCFSVCDATLRLHPFVGRFISLCGSVIDLFFTLIFFFCSIQFKTIIHVVTNLFTKRHT